jgi:hypothetical protein
MQWLDTEQSDDDKRYIESTARDARERWFHMIKAEKRGKTQTTTRGNSRSPVDERA